MSRELEAIEAATTVEEMAVALAAWATNAAKETGETSRWWLEELWRFVDGLQDEAPGVTLDELLPNIDSVLSEYRDDG
jgi:hypothetical protein